MIKLQVCNLGERVEFCRKWVSSCIVLWMNSIGDCNVFWCFFLALNLIIEVTGIVMGFLVANDNSLRRLLHSATIHFCLAYLVPKDRRTTWRNFILWSCLYYLMYLYLGGKFYVILTIIPTREHFTFYSM